MMFLLIVMSVLAPLSGNLLMPSTAAKATFDVCAIGNALVDIIADANDAFLAAQGIAKGGMTLVDDTRAEALYKLIGPAVEMSGGSAANTANGIASLGGHPAYMGKVKNDAFGKIYQHDLHAQGVHFNTPVATAGVGTGRCLILVTPDAQRSMNTYLGAAVEFGDGDIEPEVIQNAQVTYLEGYLFDRPAAKQAFRQAASIARAANRKIALTLSDTFCVSRHREEFMEFIRHDVDILFANENEMLALQQSNNLDAAIAATREICDMVITTRSEKGAVIAAGKETITVAAQPVAKLVDTTGAGDLYAAGFLFGLTHGKTLAEAGHIGAIAAAEIISHYGPRPQVKLKTLI